MNVNVDAVQTTTYRVYFELDHNSLNRLIDWMNNHTGPSAPESYKALLAELRTAAGRV